MSLADESIDIIEEEAFDGTVFKFEAVKKAVKKLLLCKGFEEEVTGDDGTPEYVFSEELFKDEVREIFGDFDK